MISIWEKQSFLTCDILIIGAGITGLSTAAAIKERDPDKKVVVLEKGILPTGASTKNAGFACFGSITEILQDIKTLGEDGMLSLVEKRWKGLQLTQKRLGKTTIDLQMKSGYELIPSMAPLSIEHINGLLASIFTNPPFMASNQKIKAFGFQRTNQLIENKYEGQLDTGKLMHTLLQYCASKGVVIHTGCEVNRIEENESDVQVLCQNLSFQSQKVIVCTNAFTNELIDIPLDLNPGRGIVLSIVPEEKIPFEGTFHYDEGYYYFRDYKDKILFGGGRNLDFKSEETTKFDINPLIKDKLIFDLKTMIIPNQGFEIAMEWSGIMAFGNEKSPIIKSISERIIVGVRLGGMGVAIGSTVGEELAKLALEDQ